MRNGRWALIGVALLLAALALGAASSALAQVQGGPGWSPGGMMGTWGVGPMMRGYGPAGMMGGFRPGQGQQPAQPLNGLDDARTAFQRYVDATGNTNLVLDEVMQFQLNYYAIVKDRSTNQGAFELLADPQTGMVFPEHGPNMMWNTQDGMLAGWGGRGMMGRSWGPPPQGQPTVDAARAQQLAQQWLDRYQPGSGTEMPVAFPGYFTLHTTKDGSITGMLSVNASSGQV